MYVIQLSFQIIMSSWLTVAIATVTCLLLSPITCLPLHDVADGKERRELLHSTWLDPSGSTGQGTEELAETSKRLLGDNNRDSGIIDLLVALRDTNTNPRDLYLHGNTETARKRRQSKVDDYGHGLFWGKRGSNWSDHGVRAMTDKDTKRGGDDQYGFGLFFGKRNEEDYEDFTL